MVASLTTPGPNMGRMTAAGLAVDPKRSTSAARMAAWRALQQPQVREAVEEEMAKHGAGIGWRVKTLRAVGDPETVLTEEKETTRQIKIKGADGEAILPAVETTKTVTRRSPSPADIARIVDTLNKMDGTYAQQNAQANVSARYATLAGRFHNLLGAPQLPISEDVPKANESKRKDSQEYSHDAKYKQYVGLLPTVRGSENLFKQRHAYHPPNARGEPTANEASEQGESCAS